MAQKENELLAGLEYLLEEFYNHATTNERKHEIEQQLNMFSMQKDSWKLCIYFMKHSTNVYVSMYALYQLELVINRQWNCLDLTEQNYLKESLSAFTFELNSTTPTFVRNKLAKISVDLAKHTWPKFYLEHYNVMIQLLQSDQGQLLGLILLRVTSEEIMNPNSAVSSNHKDMLARLCDEHIPRIFQLLTDILENLSNKKRHNATTTPPPSPTHPSQAPNLVQISAASFRTDNRKIIREVLNTLQHLISWVNLTHVPQELIITIFKFINIPSYAQEDDDVCLLAMSVLNELLYRKCAPAGTQHLFSLFYQNVVLLLRDISNPCSNKFDTICNDFIEKLSEMLTLLVEQHLWRLEIEPNFSAIEFLQHLFQVTMHLPSMDCYMRCLTVWSAFIKQIKPQNAHKYSEALQGLVASVLNKLQYNTNAGQLEELDDVIEVNDNHETDWHVFQNASIEVIALVADFQPIETFGRVLGLWKSINDIYLMLRTIDISNGTLKLETSEIQRLHCILKDLATLTQALARLSSFFMDQDAEHYKPATPIIQSLLIKLVDSACLSTAACFYNLKIPDSHLVDDFTDVHCQLLSALKTWCTWYNLNTSHKSKDLNQLLQLVLPIIRTPQAIPPKVTLSAAHLLLSITAIIHPPQFIQIPEALELIHVASTLKYPKNHSRDVVLCALSTFLLKPWGELSSSDLQARTSLILNLFNTISREYCLINEFTSDEVRCLEIVEDCLPCFVNITDLCKEFPVASKKLLYTALKPTIDHTLNIFAGLSKFAAVTEIQLQFFLKVLDVLQQQMGLNNVRLAVDVFLGVAMRDQQKNQFTGLDMLLKILQLVVESPGSSYKIFMQGIFELCMKNIYPTLIQQANEYPDAIIALINLLHSILLNRWNYFYLSQIRLGNSPGCSDVIPTSESPQQEEYLMQILQVFGQCLLQSDINIFKTSLNALETLNLKWKLYHKALFKDHMLSQFLTVLLQTMLDKTHHLLNEDIMQAFYNMAAVNFQQFFDRFLIQYLDNLKLLTVQQRNTIQHNFSHSTDMPTFVQNLQRFVNDARCFILCNTSLPAGSIAL